MGASLTCFQTSERNVAPAVANRSLPGNDVLGSAFKVGDDVVHRTFM
jgi:hypothetical protein